MSQSPPPPHEAPLDGTDGPLQVSKNTLLLLLLGDIPLLILDVVLFLRFRVAFDVEATRVAEFLSTVNLGDMINPLSL